MSEPRDPQESVEQIAVPGPKGDKGDAGGRGLPRIQARAIVYLFLLNLALIIVGYLFVAHLVRGQEHKWCSTFATINQSEQKTPPTTTSGRNLAADFVTLYRAFDCGH